MFFFVGGGGGAQTVLDKRADSNHLLALFHEATQIEWFGSCCSTGIKDANWKNHMFFDSLSFSGVFGGILFVVYTSVQYSSLSSQKRDDQKANYPESRESIREWFVLRFCVDGSVEFVVFFCFGMWDFLIFPKFLPNMVLDNSCDCNYVSTVFLRNIFRYVRF